MLQHYVGVSFIFYQNILPQVLKYVCIFSPSRKIFCGRAFPHFFYKIFSFGSAFPLKLIPHPRAFANILLLRRFPIFSYKKFFCKTFSTEFTLSSSLVIYVIFVSPLPPNILNVCFRTCSLYIFRILALTFKWI